MLPHSRCRRVPHAQRRRRRTPVHPVSNTSNRDWQPGGRRMRVDNPGFYLLKPLSDTLVIEGSLVYDGMSGASPLFFNALSGASGEGVKDYRTAGDVKLTKYFDRFSIGVGAAYSHERDYISRAGSIEFRTWTADKNRTYAFGFAGASDRINTENGGAQDEPSTSSLPRRVTQVFSPDVDRAFQPPRTRGGHGYFTRSVQAPGQPPTTIGGWSRGSRVTNEHFPSVGERSNSPIGISTTRSGRPEHARGGMGAPLPRAGPCARACAIHAEVRIFF